MLPDPGQRGMWRPGKFGFRLPTMGTAGALGGAPQRGVASTGGFAAMACAPGQQCLAASTESLEVMKAEWGPNLR
ncbi:hypothetical protein NDU88_007897 [Pleurodeles waltl]|uniref:Uncharacterized protein n=1 Tax=Pleurodeles waltl TaxID=8319 RepID=A0AAV7VUY5_PLEWA|nr:hypothetical protein NDU88_007897 [Pleurodeles waltl]